MKNVLISLLFAASIAVAAPVNYSYDAAGRLVGIDYGAGGSITYTYDSAGNITSRVVQPGMTASIVTAVKPGPDGATIRIAGTNLVPPGDGAPLSVTVDGQPAKILSKCSASSGQGCRSDQIFVSAPTGQNGARGEIVIYHDGAKVAAYRANPK